MKIINRLHSAASAILFDFRTSVGLFFIALALYWFPRAFSHREGILRGIREQLLYDHYAGYCRICNAQPWPFEKWREVSATMRRRPTGRVNVKDISRKFVVRETA